MDERYRSEEENRQVKKEEGSDKRVTELKIFLASPDDVCQEREIARQVIESISRSVGTAYDIALEAVGWEDAIPSLGDPQDIINETLEAADLVVVIFWRRWGTPTSHYDSGTLEEFLLAKERWEKDRRPHVMVFFRKIDDVFLEDPKLQLSKVLEFRKQFERERLGLYKTYEDLKDFHEKFAAIMQSWLESAIKNSLDTSVERPTEEAQTIPIPRLVEKRATVALLDAIKYFNELDEKYRILKWKAKSRALEYINGYRLRFDGQFNIIDSNRHIVFHDVKPAIGHPYKQFLPEFDKIFEHNVIRKRRGTLKWIDFLSSDYLLIDEAFYSGSRKIDWIRFNVAPFSYFAPWDWYILVEAHNEIHGFEISKIQTSIENFRRQGWLIMEIPYYLLEWARR